MPGVGKAVETLLWCFRREDFRIARETELFLRVGRGVVRISADVMIAEHVMPKRVAVLDAEPVAPVIAIAAKLRGAGLRFEKMLIRSNAKIAAAECDSLSRGGRFDLSADAVTGVVSSACAVDPVIDAPPKAVDPELLVAFIETGEEHFRTSARPSLSVSSA